MQEAAAKESELGKVKDNDNIMWFDRKIFIKFKNLDELSALKE